MSKKISDYLYRAFPCDEETLKDFFGKSVFNNGEPIRRINVVLSDEVSDQGDIKQKTQNAKDFFEKNEQSIVSTFERAAAVIFDGYPYGIKTLKSEKFFNEIGVWVRADDAEKACREFANADWVSRAEMGQKLILGDSLHR